MLRKRIFWRVLLLTSVALSSALNYAVGFPENSTSLKFFAFFGIWAAIGVSIFLLMADFFLGFLTSD